MLVNGSSARAAIRPLDRLFALHAIGKGLGARAPERLERRPVGSLPLASRFSASYCFPSICRESGGDADLRETQGLAASLACPARGWGSARDPAALRSTP